MFKVLKNGTAPTSDKYGVGVTLYASEDIAIGAGDEADVGLGVCIHYGKIRKIVGESYKKDIKENGISKANSILNKNVIEFLASHYLQLTIHEDLTSKGLIQPAVKMISLDYEDEIKVLVYNPHSENTIQNSVLPMITDLLNQINNLNLVHTFEDMTSYKINKGDKIAQITLLPHMSYLFGVESGKD